MKRYLMALFAAIMVMFSCSVCAAAEDGSSGSGSSPVTIAVSAVVGGLLVAGIGTGSMKAQLKSVRSEKAARPYIKQGSFKVTTRRDIYLYQKVERREKPKSQ